jgi:hypothetical protein
MSRKSKERRKKQAEGKDSPDAKPSTTSEIFRRRRNKRFLVVGLIAITFPILEVIAYQFRAITITMVNRSNVAIKGIKVSYTGGGFDAPDLKPGASLTRLIRPDFSFKRETFSTYALSIRYTPENGMINGFMGRVGAIDYSAQEMYTFSQSPPDETVQLQHASRPGFPLSLVRDLMERLGFG